jgi:hypothetical protein
MSATTSAEEPKVRALLTIESYYCDTYVLRTEMPVAGFASIPPHPTRLYIITSTVRAVSGSVILTNWAGVRGR